jgi:hypothetical protein
VSGSSRAIGSTSAKLFGLMGSTRNRPLRPHSDRRMGGRWSATSPRDSRSVQRVRPCGALGRRTSLAGRKEYLACTRGSGGEDARGHRGRSRGKREAGRCLRVSTALAHHFAVARPELQDHAPRDINDVEAPFRTQTTISCCLGALQSSLTVGSARRCELSPRQATSAAAARTRPAVQRQACRRTRCRHPPAGGSLAAEVASALGELLTRPRYTEAAEKAAVAIAAAWADEKAIQALLDLVHLAR